MSETSPLPNFPYTAEHCELYGRQMILPGMTPENVSSLFKSRVLVIGAGGLGSPICLYLAGAGIGSMAPGCLGIVDGDSVSLSNLHRQVLHTVSQVDVNKAESAKISISRLNPDLNIRVFNEFLSVSLALSIFPEFDVIVDATDNANIRYIINDCAVLTNRPVVSASALRFEGQMCIYNFDFPNPKFDAKTDAEPEFIRGPCYRCLFPSPPANVESGACDVHGVLGTTPGLMGVWQANEVLKIAAKMHETVLRNLLIVDLMDPCTPVRSIKIRPRQSSCIVCADSSNFDARNFDYDEFAPKCMLIKPVSANGNISSLDFYEKVLKFDENKQKITSYDSANFHIIDVRPHAQFNCLHLPDTQNITLAEIKRWKNFDAVKMHAGKKILLLCRRGNDSRLAYHVLHHLKESSSEFDATFLNVDGGLVGLKKHIKNLPIV